jgi:hypothetical protein
MDSPDSAMPILPFLRQRLGGSGFPDVAALTAATRVKVVYWFWR